MEKADEKIAALEHLGLVQNDALRVLIEHVRALTVVNVALLVQLGDRIDRDAIRSAASIALGAHGHVPGGLAGTLVEALTREPAGQQDDAGATLTRLSARLQ
ncbi:hypothetical protein [Methylobacterium fujisawaense]|uniref:hypothetical protein n=1 Tax=Methylobacterium fujisawaense TaxID=107400 RepID=UPI002449CA5B|nr:hypothetical protein [Methylobacterium fujisawaense]MDH3031063.1 hypothetical protein [Methylobacterium fujisawaense]